MFVFTAFLISQERSEEKDGKITTETTKHEHHEEVDDDEQPDEEGRPASNTSSIHEVVKETRNNYTTSKDEDQVRLLNIWLFTHSKSKNKDWWGSFEWMSMHGFK